jgi:prophage maintenance system killer protein
MPEDGEAHEDSPQEIRYLTAEHILILHEAVLEPYENAAVLDGNLVGSVAVRPQTRYFGEEQFPGLMLKAAVLLHGLAAAQLFVTGNKRTAWEVARVFLGWNGWRVAQVTSLGEYQARKESIGRLLDQIGGQELTDLHQIRDKLHYYFEPGRPAKGRYRQGQALTPPSRLQVRRLLR